MRQLPSVEVKVMNNNIIALDTNVLVRVFVNDPDNPKQNELARELVNQYENIYISQIVQVELIWVLSRRMNFDKQDIIKVLEIIYHHNAIILEYPERFLKALELYKNHSADFSDYLIFSYANENNCPFWTFDKKLSKTQGVNILLE